MHQLRQVQNPLPQTIWPTEATAHPEATVGLHLHGLHQAVTHIGGIHSVGRIIVQYPAHLCSPFSTLTAIPIFPFYILYPASTKNAREPPLNSNSTHIHLRSEERRVGKECRS